MGQNVHYTYNTVNGGEISNQLDARVETEKYKASARILENFVVKPYGAISKRPGTQYLNNTKSNQIARLEPFKRSTTENYILEFSQNNLRIWKDSFPIILNKTDYSTLSSFNWTSGSNYSANQIVYSLSSNNVLFECTTSHVSNSSNAPLVGANWPSYWSYKTFNNGSVIYANTSSASGLYRCEADSSTKDSLPGNENYWTRLETFSSDKYYFDIKTPYLSGEIFNVQVAQINDVMFIAHENYHPKVLKRFSDDHWTFENVKFDFAPSLDPNEGDNTVKIIYNYDSWGATNQWTTATNYISGVRVYGDGNPNYNVYTCISSHTAGSTNEPGTLSGNSFWSLLTYKVGDRVVNSLGDLYTCHTAHTPKRLAGDALYEPGITVGSWSNYWNSGASSTFSAAAWSLGYGLYSIGDRVTRDGLTYRCIVAHYSGSGYEIYYAPGTGSNWTYTWELINNSIDIGTPVVYALQSTADLFTNSDVDANWQVNIGASDAYVSIDLGGLAGTYVSDSIFIQKELLVNSNWDSGIAMIGTLSLEESFDNETWNTIKSWISLDTTKGNVSYSFEAPSTGAWYRIKAVKSSGGNRNFTLEQVNSVNSLNLKIKSIISNSKVICESTLTNSQIIPDRLIGVSTPIYKKPAFTSINGFPKTVSYHENRIWWSGVNSQPGRLWASASEDFYNFLIGTGSTDSLDITLGSTSTNKILWMKSYNRSLVIGTEGEIFSVDSGEQDQTLASDNIRSKLRTRYGCSDVPAIVTGDSLLFFQRGKKRLREFGYRFESDSYSSPDMTVLSEHVCQGGFVQAAYQINLEPVLWATTVDGALAGFSYDREQNITAWHRHITGDRNTYYNDNNNADKFISVCTVFGKNDSTDQVWFVIKRKINNDWKYYVERFDPDNTDFVYAANLKEFQNKDLFNFFDCKISSSLSAINGSNVSYSGLGILNGRNVFYSNNQNSNYSLSTTTISNSSTTINNSYSGTVNFGLPIFCVYSPSRINFNLDNGDIQSRKIRIDRINFKLWRSCDGGYKLYGNQNYTNSLSSVQFKPVETDSFDKIKYEDFIYNFNIDNNGGTDSQKIKTGQTKDFSINGDWNTNQMLAITHYSPSPFTILSTQYKLEVNGN